MKVAIYARYSTNLQDKTSIDGQVANCEALAAREGFDVVRHYQDAAQSGNDDSRRQYQQLLADSEAGLFDAIIVDETSRLTRRPGELPRLLEILAFRNQFLLDCSGFDSRQETASLLASIYGGIDSLELKRLSGAHIADFANDIRRGSLPVAEPTDTRVRLWTRPTRTRNGARSSMMKRPSGLYGF